MEEKLNILTMPNNGTDSATAMDSSYFSSDNFEEHDLTEVDSGGNYVYLDAITLGVGANYFRVSAQSASSNKIILENDGTAYKLKKLPEYYFKISGAASNGIAYGAIISRVNPDNGDYLLKASDYVNTNTKIIDLVNVPRTVYIKHTPQVESGKTYQNYTTYIVDGYPLTQSNLLVYLNIKILIPKNNN